MPRLAWLTDLHLNFVSRRTAGELFSEVASQRPDAVVVTGDTADARSFGAMLRQLAAVVARPVYFVLGNHDYYHGSIDRVREEARESCRQSEWLHWLSDGEAFELSPGTAIAGHDGWGDGRHGDIARSRVRLNDFELIADLAGLFGTALVEKLGELGDEAGAHLQRVVPPAARRYEHVIIATHVPPFPEAAWHQGRISNDEWLPFFSCRAAGEAIRAAFMAHPSCRGLVLCGHTHGAGEADILPNLHVSTGGSEYYRPALQRILEVA